MEGLQPFEGFICDVTVNGTSLKCLRDSGSSQSILADLSSENLTYTKEFITITDSTSSRTLPLAELEIVSPYFIGKAKVAVLKQALPCSPVKLILGNDLAGSQVKTNFIISDPEFVIQEENKSIESPPAITQVVTRNTSRAAPLKNESKTTGRTMEALDLVNVGKKEFTELQKEDPSLSELWKKVDASGTGYGAVLLQSYAPNDTSCIPTLHYLPVAYHSRFFRGAQTRWATVEKELYAIVASLQHFQPYLEGHRRVIVFTDHRPLTFLNRARLKNLKLLRWSYILGTFNIQLQSIKGTNNTIADTLSRLPSASSAGSTAMDTS
ncbi:uncharacterized protein [Palaemon carinicauda]|uniref:uncharacterized protein n=1 Tax=Palaemon carinicauda TaxID=392227 RepID=UPI0035B66FB2